ncbi:MAG: phosphoribosylaminoimidazolesuccinocarboxamide synthase [Bdellovibrionota bacterium]
MKLLAHGSNKDIYEIEAEPRHLAFRFSGRISVFDVGALAEEIPGRSEALSLFARAVADHLAARGIPQAYDSELSKAYDVFVQRRVTHPRIDTSIHELSFVPLEIIVRWGVPVGSSLVKKDPERFKVGTRFKTPSVDFTTKLEAQDRALDREEAATLCPVGLKIENLEAFVLHVGQELKEMFASRELEIWDAKFETGFDPVTGKIFLVDAITPDEIRLTLKGFDAVPLSKELLRFWLRQTPWFDDVSRRKSAGGDDWKNGLSRAPRLGAWRLDALSRIYRGLAELVAGVGSQTLLSVLRGEGQKPKVHIIGSGGREAALAWRFEKEGCDVVADAAQADMTFVGMDADLASGVADTLRAQGVWAVGPSQAASRLEWSKHFGREVADDAAIRSPHFDKHLSDFDPAGRPPVLKMDGLAAGKGVFLFDTWPELETQVRELKSQEIEFHLEERCEGYEASVFFNIERDAWGRVTARYLGSAQDFKRRHEGDHGPNTGGMGALSPHPKLKTEDLEIFRGWALKTAEQMEKRGTPYRGVIYLGAMKDKRKSWVLIEYNARFGDPETQALVLLWPESLSVARSLGQLSLSSLPEEISEETAQKTLCLALVHPEYPKSCLPVKLPTWQPRVGGDLAFFRTSSLTGRLAYLVGRGTDYPEAAKMIASILAESPWKGLVEWRADILK